MRSFLLFFSVVTTLPLFAQTGNLIPNGDFSKRGPDGFPGGWTPVAKRSSLAPHFRRIEEGGQGRLLIEGNGLADGVGFIRCETSLELGRTYLFSVRFRVGPTINPQRNLLFECAGPKNLDGIFEYTREGDGTSQDGGAAGAGEGIMKEGPARDARVGGETWDGWINGKAKVYFPGTGKGKVTVRILYRFSDTGRVVVGNISLVPTDSVQPRWVRVACTGGIPTLADIPVLAEKAAANRTDLLLLPEYMNGEHNYETLEGPSCQLMSELALRYHMYIAGGILRKVDTLDRMFNTVVLYDRNGRFAGMYDKIHPYSPEVNEDGVTPGNKTLVLQTDFGKIGFMTCYDSWFTDVAELVALQGAELILFPNAGYYRSLMPARAADNNVRILASSLYTKDGIWDTEGRDVLNLYGDSSVNPQPGETCKDMMSMTVGKMNLQIASLDLNFSPSPHYNGGSMSSSPAGRRNRRDQLYYPDEDIIKEKQKWWKE
jgi:predicted amidohydrolase